MHYAATTQITTARHIARLARQEIKNKTGMGVSLMFCPVDANLKTPEKMLAIVAGALDMPFESFTIRSRTRDIVELRFIGALFLRRNFPLITLHQIAALFGGMDHSTIIGGLTRAQEMIYQEDTRFFKKYTTVLNIVNLWLRKEELESA